MVDSKIIEVKATNLIETNILILIMMWIVCMESKVLDMPGSNLGGSEWKICGFCKSNHISREMTAAVISGFLPCPVCYTAPALQTTVIWRPVHGIKRGVTIKGIRWLQPFLYKFFIAFFGRLGTFYIIQVVWDPACLCDN